MKSGGSTCSKRGSGGIGGALSSGIEIPKLLLKFSNLGLKVAIIHMGGNLKAVSIFSKGSDTRGAIRARIARILIPSELLLNSR